MNPFGKRNHKYPKPNMGLRETTEYILKEVEKTDEEGLVSDVILEPVALDLDNQDYGPNKKFDSLEMLQKNNINLKEMRTSGILDSQDPIDVAERNNSNLDSVLNQLQSLNDTEPFEEPVTTE